MVQVLPYVQTPLEQLTPYLANAAGAAGSMWGAHIGKNRDASIMKTIADPKSTATQVIQAYSLLSAAGRKDMSPIIAAYVKPKTAMEEAQKYANKPPKDGELPEGVTPVEGTGQAEQAQPPGPPQQPPPPPMQPQAAEQPQMPQAPQPQLQGQVAPPQAQPKPQAYNVKGLEGMQFTPEEVKTLTPPTRSVAVGPLAGEAQIQAKEMASAKSELSKYTDPISASLEPMRVKRAGLNRVEKLYDSGKAGSEAVQNVVGAFIKDIKFPGGNVLESLMRTPESKEAATILRDQLAGVKEFGGSRPAVLEVLIQKDALPNYLDSKADAKGKINSLREVNDYKIKRAELIQKLAKKNPYMSVAAIEDMAGAKMAPDAARLLNKMDQGGIAWNGEMYNIPPDKVQAFMSSHPGSVNTYEIGK